MVSTFTTNKVLEKPGNGDYVNTWNVPVNGDMDVIDQAFGGVTSLNASTGSATLTSTQFRSLFLKVSGSITASVTYTIPSSVGGQWIIYNTTTDSGGGPFSVTFASGGAGLSVNVPRNVIVQIISDGTNIYSVAGSGSSGSSFSRTSYTATAGQTVFAVSYTVSRLLVFVNGVLLSQADYTATDGTTVTLATACNVSDLVDLCPY